MLFERKLATQPRDRSALRRRINATGAITGFAVVVAALFVTLRLRNETVAYAERELMTVSQLTAERTSQTLSSADLLLRSVQDLALKPAPPDEDSFRARIASPAFHDALVNLAKLLPQVDSETVFDAEGSLMATSRAVAFESNNTANRAWLQALKQQPGRGLIIYGPKKSPATGQWTLLLMRSLSSPNGRFLGAAVVGIPIKYFEDYFSTIEIGPGQAVTLVDETVRLIARWPRLDALIGQELPHVADGFPFPDGPTLVESLGGDGPTRVLGMTRLKVEGTSLWLAVSQPRGALWQPWHSSLIGIGFFVLTSLMVLTILLLRLLRAVCDEERWSADLVERETLLSKQAVDLVAARDVAEASSRARGEFLANMSHELRTPLNAVMGFSELLGQEQFGPLGDARYREFVQRILVRGNRLLEIIKDILDISDARAGKFELDERMVDVVDLLRGCVRRVGDAAGFAGVEVTLDLPSRAITLWCDPNRLRQVVLNLLYNTIKFAAGGTNVTLAAEETESCLVLRVTHDGMGMPREQIAKAARIFRQSDDSLSDEYQDPNRYEETEFGLALTKYLIDLHDGMIRIDSVPGGSVTITVGLPKSRPGTGPAEPGQSRRSRVLANN